SATTLAFPVRTRTSARRKVMTASGSYPAFRTRVRIRIPLHGRTRQRHEGRLPSAWSGYGSITQEETLGRPINEYFFAAMSSAQKVHCTATQKPPAMRRGSFEGAGSFA